MGKWISETLGLESKKQLKEHRKHKWQGLLGQNDLDLQRHPWWSADDIDLEATLWAKADVDYEERKLSLKNQITKLAVKKKVKYFKEIGIDERDEAVWLAPS